MRYRLHLFALSFLLLFQIMMFPALAAPDWPSDTGIMAEGGIVIDADSGAVLFSQNIHQPYPPASITKLVTALVALEHSNLSDLVTFSEDAVNNVEQGSGNKLNIAVGDTLSVEDCLYLLLLQSSNQAANALAEHVAGSRDGFVTMMNERIAKIGCTESRFANPSGLNDTNQYVTAFDMAMISKEAFSNEQLLTIDSATNHKIPATANNPEGASFRAEHRLVITTDTTSPYYYPDAVAGKTGYTSIAGNTLVTYAKRDGRSLISVVLKGQPRQYFVDGKTMLEFGFTNFKNLDLAGNETSYTSGTKAITINGVDYSPGDLTLEEGTVITLPRTAEFTDAERELVTQLPDGSPERAVALLRYTYKERQVGRTFLMRKELPIPKATPSQSPSITATVQPEVKPETPTPKGPGVLPYVIGILALLFAGAAACFFYIRKREQKEQARRRAKRRQRLADEHISEEEFDRLLKEKKEKFRKQK